MRLTPWILLAALSIGGSTAAGAQEKTIKVGIARSTSNAAELMALKHGIFNALEKNLPITMLSDRVSTPIGHNLMLRPELKDKVKSLKDLKGKVLASNGQGSVSTYEVGKMLEREGLSINDVELKILPFPQMGIAFKNGAI